jgi:hypothetical protein
VTSFVRRFRDEILDDWRRAARQLPPAKNLNTTKLLDHIPDLLDGSAQSSKKHGTTN